MKGKHHIVIESDNLKYEFDIKRNITVIQGESGTGKTTLIELLGEHIRRKGVGGMLVKACFKKAEELGFHGVSVTCQDNNLSAALFYIKQGFEFYIISSGN